MTIALRLHLLLSVLLLSAAVPALAVYKCEKDGKTGYSDLPCAGGVELGAAPPSDAAAANRQLARDKAQAERLAAERHRREAKEEKQRKAAARAQAAKEKKCANLARRKRWADEDVAVADIKSTDKSRRKAKRAAEVYREECERS